MATNRQKIIEAFNVTVVASGFLVYAGGTPSLGEDDPDVVVAVILGDDEPGHQMQNIHLELGVGVEVIAKASLDNPYDAIEDALGVLKTNIETPDRSLGGLLRNLSRGMERGGTIAMEFEPGSTVVGRRLMYVLSHVEGWGSP